MKLYQHSGKLGRSPILVALVGIPLIIILSCLYSYIIVYNPISGYITFLILAAYVLGGGFLIALLARKGKCRSKTFLTVAGIIAGLLGLYFSWVFFLYALSQRAGYDDVGLLDILLSPGAMLEAIQSINETGWFTIKGSTPSGIVLWVLWAIEAAAIIFGFIYMTAFSIDEDMFCEKCDAWCEPAEAKIYKIPEQCTSSKGKNINPLTLENLEGFKDEEGVSLPFISAERLKCGNCVNYSGWRYKLMSSEIEKDGSEKIKADSIPGIVLAQ